IVLSGGIYDCIDPPKPTCLADRTVDYRYSLGAEIYFDHILGANRSTRLGLQAFSLWATSKPVSSNDSTCDYRLISYLFSLQRRVYRKDFFHLLLGLSAGPCWRNWSGPNERYNPFRNLSLGFSVQPGVYCIFKLYKTVGIQINGRFNHILTGKDFHPFSSGFDLQAGLLLVIAPRK
ncbi:MAG: hypothetical protein GTO09_14015, partial [Candidatus Latescibacteria bacterium]|nr:hypothetical protein [Candidatus Latescibacterota bacterium]